MRSVINCALLRLKPNLMVLARVEFIQTLAKRLSLLSIITRDNDAISTRLAIGDNISLYHRQSDFERSGILLNLILAMVYASSSLNSPI